MENLSAIPSVSSPSGGALISSRRDDESSKVRRQIRNVVLLALTGVGVYKAYQSFGGSLMKIKAGDVLKAAERLTTPLAEAKGFSTTLKVIGGIVLSLLGRKRYSNMFERQFFPRG